MDSYLFLPVPTIFRPSNSQRTQLVFSLGLQNQIRSFFLGFALLHLAVYYFNELPIFCWLERASLPSTDDIKAAAAAPAADYLIL